MSYQKVEPEELVAGQPLRWDVFDANRIPLLRRGAVIQRQEQIDALLERGLYRLAGRTRPPRPPGDAAAIDMATTNPFTLIERARGLLSKMVRMQVPPGMAVTFPEAIYRIAHLLRKAVFSNKDAAIASMLVKPGPSYTIKHMIDSAIIVEIILEGMNVPADERLSLMAAALTMNLGMAELQETIHHRLGSLSPNQQAQIRLHPQAGYNLLQQAGVTDTLWLEAVLQHHELLDGSGYPAGLSGDALSRGARAVCIADVFSAWICPRGDRPNLLPNAAMREIFLMRGSRYDADISSHLVKHIGIYPAGTVLQLQKGEIAVVIRQGSNVQRPLASVIIDAQEQKIASPTEREINASDARVLSAFRPDTQVNPDEIWGYRH